MQNDRFQEHSIIYFISAPIRYVRRSYTTHEPYNHFETLTSLNTIPLFVINYIDSLYRDSMCVLSAGISTINNQISAGCICASIGK